MAEGYKRRIRAHRTRGYLVRDRELSRSDENKLEALSELELAAAARNPDHSDAGRARAEQLLRARGGDLDVARVAVPGFVRTSDLARLRRSFLGVARIVRMLAATLSIIAVVAGIGMAFWTVELESKARDLALERGVISQLEHDAVSGRMSEAERAAFLEENGFSRRRALDLEVRARLDGAPEARAVARTELIGVSLFLAAPSFYFLWIAMSTLRRQPARVLLLRGLSQPTLQFAAHQSVAGKAVDKEIAKTAQKLIFNQLADFGHVVTFADHHFRPAALGWFGEIFLGGPIGLVLKLLTLPLKLALRLFNRAKGGFARVRSAGEFRGLAWRLRDRLGLNYDMVVSRRGAFVVTPSEQWRPAVSTLLVDSAHVIVLDLTAFSAERRWEIDLLDELEAWDRVVLVRREDDPSSDQTVADHPRMSALPVNCYGQSGHISPGHRFAGVKNGDIHAGRFFNTEMISAVSRAVQRRAGAGG